jgi:hypothetical protein
MAIEQRLRASLLAQLLAGDEPRCFWAPAGVVENPAFEAQAEARGVVAAAARAVFAGEPPQSVQAGAFSWTFTRIVHEGFAGVFVCGTPSPVTQDRRLRALPEILRFHSGRLPNVANLHRLMDLVIAADPHLFADALLFSSQNGKPFVLLHNAGQTVRGLRSWARWPLERLFSKRSSALISNPLTLQRGLAIPFLTPPAERYVVVFALRPADLSQSDRDFLGVLESVTAVVRQPALARRVSTYDRIETAPVPLAPRLLYYGRPELETRIHGLLEGHAWELTGTRNFREMLAMIASPFDVVVIDSVALSDPVTMLRWLRHAAPNIPVVYFDAGSDAEIEILVDERVPIAASDEEYFTAIKNVVRQLPQRRRDYLDTIVRRAAGRLSAATSYNELARAITRCLVTYFGDWGCVHLFDLEGELYHAELPARDEPLLSHVPMTFLNGYAVMKTRVDEEFFAEVCEEREAQIALASTQPRSGAALPLACGGRLVGSMIVLSTARDLDEADFEALARFAENASHAFAALQVRLQRKSGAGDAWTRVSVAGYDVDVYQPPNAGASTFRATLLSAKTIGIEVQNENGGSLSATLDINAQALAFEATHFPPPAYVGASGPVALLQTDVRDRAQGSISLAESSVTLVYDAEFARSAESARVVEILQHGLRDGEENPAALLAAVSGERFPFIAITFR